MHDFSYLCFISVCETSSFSNTASELLITQQAVSRYIQKLEDDLGVPLLIRDQGLVSPTVAGRYLYRFLKEFNQLYQDIQLKTKIIQPMIRIGVSGWLGNGRWLTAASAAFHHKFPGWQLVFYEIEDDQALDMLSHQQLDCYLTTNYTLGHIRIPTSRIKLFSTELCLACAADRECPETHLTAPSGETDESFIKARDIRIFQELHLPLRGVEIFPNHASAFWNTCMGKGQCFIPSCNPITENPFFMIQPLSRPVDVVLGIVSSPNQDMIQELAGVIKEAVT